MKFSTDGKQLHKALKLLSKVRATDESRPALCCVQMTAKENTLKLEALDGYCLAERNLEASVEHPGIIMINPDVLVPALTGCKGTAVLEASDSELTVLTDKARAILPLYTSGEYPKTYSIWPDIGRDATEIWINPQIVITMLQALADRGRPVCLNVPLSPIKPIVITTADAVPSRGLVLPVRMPR